MTWIRDNLLKVAILLGVVIIIIVLVSVLSGLGGSTSDEVKATGYEELENKVQSAAKKYLNDNKEMLPKSSDKDVTIKLETLQRNDYIGKVYSVEDDNTVCSGYVVVKKKTTEDNSYSIFPYLSCGRYYKTMTMSDYIIEKENIVTDGDGLYKQGENYIYKGENPKNYLLIDGRIYRIISVLSDGKLKLISETHSRNSYIWDDRYNGDINKYYGINNYFKSRMRDTLLSIYDGSDDDSDNPFFSDLERDYMIDYDFCVGKIEMNTDFGSLKTKECAETSNQKIGLINASDYINASADKSCFNLVDKRCNNYNYLFSFNHNSFVIMNANAANSYTYFTFAGGSFISKKSSSSTKIYPVIYISENNLYKTGEGTKKNPYVIR